PEPFAGRRPRIFFGTMHLTFLSRRGGLERGYTLSEVLVSVFVLGILIVSLYAGFSSGFAMLQLSREESRATQILLQKMEVLRLCNWSELARFPKSFQERFDPLAATNDSHGILFRGSVHLEPAQ